MSTAGYVQEYPTFGWAAGSVRGILSVLICSFFWILLLLPEGPPETEPMKAPLGHFFLLTIVFMAFASHPLPESKTRFLPWALRVLFVGGSIVVVIFSLSQNADLTAARLTPSKEDITQWPVLLACLAGGFGAALFLRFVLGRQSPLFMTIRAWIGSIAMLLLVAETLLQFVILPGVTEKNPDALKIWEGIVIAFVAAYFGARA